MIVSDYVNKSQQKIMALGDIIEAEVRKGMYADTELKAAIELIDFQDSLLAARSPWTEEQKDYWTDFMSVRHNLVDIPFAQFDEFEIALTINPVVDPNALYVTHPELTQAVNNLELVDVDFEDRISALENFDYSTILPAGLLDDVAAALANSIANAADIDTLFTNLDNLASALAVHIADTSKHIQPGERAAWNAKVTAAQLAAGLATKADVEHTHDIADVDGLQDALDALQDEIDNLPVPTNGTDGETPVIAIGTVESGSPASVTIDPLSTPLNPILNFVLEKGDKGDPFVFSEIGLFADRSDFDLETPGFIYLAVDTGMYYTLLAPSTWSAGIEFKGWDGWTPQLGLYQLNADTVVVEIVGFIGGTGPVPTLTPPGERYFLTNGGYTTIAENATNIKGNIGGDGAKGDRFFIDEQGTNIALYDAELKGFTFLNTATGMVFFKLSDTSGDWSVGFPWIADLTALTAVVVNKVDKNAPITPGTKTKITYDAKGLVTNGADATTADIADSTDKRYVTEAEKTKLANTSGLNSGDETISSLGTKLTSATSEPILLDTDEVLSLDMGLSSILRTTWAVVKTFLKTYFDTVYQAVLVSGTNIKTINSTSLLGSGNIVISGGATTVTKSALDTLISTDALVPGGIYIVTGVDTALYGGTTIIMKAATVNQLELAGHGIFYTPKYDQSTVGNGYGIWSDLMVSTVTNIVGIFDINEPITADNSATGIWKGAGIIQYVSGNWTAAVSITGDTNAGTADITGQVTPSYSASDRVIWGGKHWDNVAGALGSATDKYTLSAAWTVVAFNGTDYNVFIDEIHYDYVSDMIVSRKDRFGNHVSGNSQFFEISADPLGYNNGNPIKDFQWGNGQDDFDSTLDNYKGVAGNHVKNSYFDCLNFTGKYCIYNECTDYSRYYSNIFDKTSQVKNNKIRLGSNFDNNVLANNSSVSFNDLFNSCSLQLNILNNSEITENELKDNSQINHNSLLDGSGLLNNHLCLSSITNNSLLGAGIYNNSLNLTSSIYLNIIIEGEISDNHLFTYSKINTNTINSSQSISKNSLLSDSLIYDNVNVFSIIDNFLSSNSWINGNSCSDSSNFYIVDNRLNAISFITGNISDGANNRIQKNGIDGGGINNNILSTVTNEAIIESNVLSNGFIEYNELGRSCYIWQNNVGPTGSITSNVLVYTSAGSSIERNYVGGTAGLNNTTLNDSVFKENILNKGILIFTSVPANKTIAGLRSNDAGGTYNLSASTFIFNSYSREMFKNSSGGVRIGYYNASSVWATALVTA